MSFLRDGRAGVPVTGKEHRDRASYHGRYLWIRKAVGLYLTSILERPNLFKFNMNVTSIWHPILYNYICMAIFSSLDRKLMRQKRQGLS